MKISGKSMRFSVVLMLPALLWANAAWSIDYLPFDWVPLPAGTSVLLAYYEYSKSEEFDNARFGYIKQDTHLESDIGVIRYQYHGVVFDHHWDFNVSAPFGTLRDGKVAGQSLGSATGAADPIFSAGYWLISQPEEQRYLSFAGYISPPLGSDDDRKALNLGSNRWKPDLQVDFMQGFRGKLYFDINLDWITYGHNSDANAVHQSLSENPTYAIYTWLSYDVSGVMKRALPRSFNAFISIGYEQTFGGAQRLNGIDTGGRTVEHQLRVALMMFVSPTWQTLISVSHDDSVVGQFRQNLGVTLRAAKLF